MKIRLADVIGGAAKSLDTRLQDDMRRTEERAENVAKERRLAREAQKQKDKEFEEAMTTYTEGIQATLGPNATCLLYTSPSPRDRQKSRMPSSA